MWSNMFRVVLVYLFGVTPCLLQQAPPIFFGNPAAFQYSNFPNSNFPSNQSPTGTVFVPFQSRVQQPSSPTPRRDYYNPQTFPSAQPAVFQPQTRYNHFQQQPSPLQQQDRLAPPRPSHFVQEPNLYNREPPRSQVQVHFEHTPSIRLEAPTGRKLKTPEDYNFPRAPDIPRNVEQNLFEIDYNRRPITTTTTQRPTTSRQPSGLRRYKPGTRTQPGLRNNVLTLPKAEETTPRPQRTRTKNLNNNNHNGGRTRYRVIPQRFRTRPPLSILQEPPFDHTTPISQTSTPIYDFSKITAESVKPTASNLKSSGSEEYDTTGPELLHPAIAGVIPSTDISAPLVAETGPSAPDYPHHSDYPTGVHTETNGTSDYPSGEEDYLSNPESDVKSKPLPETNPEIVPHEEIHNPEIIPHINSQPTQNETFEVITMKSQPMLVKDDNFKGFVDSVLIDTAPTISSQKLDEETNTEETGTVSVSVHTAVSTIPHATTPSSIPTQSESSIIEIPPTPESKVHVTNSTESWVVVASVQTSRSVSGARFIPFNTGIKQEEKVFSSLKDKSTTLPPTTINEKGIVTETTTEKIMSSTESVHDMLDRVQSELSNSFLSANSPNSFVTVSPSTTTTTTTTTTTEAPLFERKFSPSNRNNQNKNKSRIPQSILESIQFDDLTSGLLPPGFKPRQGQNSFRNRPVTTTTTEKLLTSSTTQVTSTTTEKSKINFENLDPALLPPGFKLDSNPIIESTTAKQENTPRFPVFKPKIKNLPVPGLNSSRSSSGKSLNSSINTNNLSSNKGAKNEDNIPASLLPPGFKTKTDTVPLSLLPPGFKSEPEKVEPTSLLADILSKAKVTDVSSSLLPPGFKPEPVNIPSLLPPGFSLNSTENTPESTTSKFNLPKPGTGTRKPFGSARFTSPKPTVAGGAEGSGESGMSTLKINKGWPTRATTEFTGWPTSSTTPLSIEKLLEMQARTTTSSTTTSSTTSTTTTTTTTTTPRPTTPGVCTNECQLAGTIRVTAGAQWQPELMDRNTAEYRALAANISNELKSAYEKSDALNKIFRKVWIDAFNKGSVLVDYIVQIDATAARHLDTMELKRMFHESLKPAPPPTTPTPTTSALDDYETGVIFGEQTAAHAAEPPLKPRLQLGVFQLDPEFTDFVVLPMSAEPTALPSEDDDLLPQWAIAVIVIGLASLLFVIIFGVSVLVNRQQAAQAKQPVMLTDAMLNELGKDHMGGYDNMAAVDDLYGMDAVWEQRPAAPEPLRFAKRLSKAGSASLGYDSWRSDWGGNSSNYYGYHGNGSASGRERDFYAPPSQTSAGGRRRPPDYDTNF